MVFHSGYYGRYNKNRYFPKGEDFLTQLLTRLFVKNHQDLKKPAVRTAYGNLASLVGVVCNLILVVGKLAAGSLFGSIAIVADGINNLSDASSSLVSLAGFRLAAKGPDEKHPYGHARYEYLAGLAVSTMIMAIGLSLLKDSALKVLRVQRPVGGGAAFFHLPEILDEPL